MSEIILICGPAGGGKSTLARKLATPGHALVSTDDYISSRWDAVPLAAAVDVSGYIKAGKSVVLEGVRALSVVYHNPSLRKHVTKVYWCDRGRDNKPGSFARGLLTRQRELLRLMKFKAIRST
jgi:adenylate kinase family enzyme